MKAVKLDYKKESVFIPQTYMTYELSRGEKLNFIIICGVGLTVTAYLFYHSIILSLVFAGFTYPGLRLYSNYLAEKRRNELKEQFRDLLYSLSASISTGRQMTESLYEAEQNMRIIYKNTSIIVLELSYMVKRIHDSRESEEQILRDFAKRSCIEDISNFVDIYYTCRATGGDLIKVVTKTSDILMDKMTIDKEINTLTAQKRFEAKILTVIPLIVIVFLQVASPDYFAVMYEGIKGRSLMTLALLGIGLSYLWSMKIIKIEI